MKRLLSVDLTQELLKIAEDDLGAVSADLERDLYVLNQNAERGGSYFWLYCNEKTWLLPQSEVFMRDSASYIIFDSFKNDPSSVRVYSIEVYENSPTKAQGSLYELSYSDSLAFVKQNALQIGGAEARYQFGVKKIDRDQRVKVIDPKFGRLLEVYNIVEDPKALKCVLQEFNKLVRRE